MQSSYFGFALTGCSARGGRRGLLEVSYATQKHYTKDDAPRSRIAPKSNGSRSKTLVAPGAHRMAGVQFRRQHAIGNYIVDFCSPRRKIVIELDGSQHLDQAAYDVERTKHLEANGYRVLRFWNNDVMNNIEVVLNAIWNEINKVP